MALINDRIKSRRQQLGLTLLQVAEALGVKEATAQRYESGDIKNIKHDTVLGLSRILHCDPAYLMGWVDSPVAENGPAPTYVGASGFWENYRALCEKAKKSPNSVAGEIGVSSGTVTGWKNGAIPRKPVLEKLAAYFGVTIGYLLGENTAPSYPEEYDNLFPVTRRRYPLLGDIACGEPIFAEEDRESYIESGTDIQADFCLRAKGDSMIGARILDGDIVFIQKMPMVDNGSIAAVIIDNEATLKRVYYYPEDRKLVLAAENAKYAPFVYVGEELDHICILGKAIAFQSDVR